MAKEINLVRVYNRSNSSTISHVEGGKTYRAAPSAMSEVPEHVAKLWKDSYPKQIIDAGVAQKEIGGVHAELQEVKAALAASEKRVAELSSSPSKNDSAAVKEMKAKLTEAQDQVAALQLQAEEDGKTIVALQAAAQASTKAEGNI
jgi:hypothetical protein